LKSRPRRAASIRTPPCGNERIAHSPYARSSELPRGELGDQAGQRPGMGFIGSSGSVSSALRQGKCPSRHRRRPPPPERGDWPRDGGTYPCEVVGHRLSHRPPDVHRLAFTIRLVFEDLRSDRSRMREHSVARPS